MKILSFDTSSDKMFINIAENTDILAGKILQNSANNYHTAYLIPVIVELLKNLNLKMQDIDALGVNIGPGSFTGIRVASVTARIIAKHVNIPAIGVPSLEIYSKLNNTEKNAVCLMDAKKGKTYIAVYSALGEIIRHPEAIIYEEAIEIIKNNDYFVIADTIMAKKLEGFELNSTNFQTADANYGIYLNELTNKYLNTTDLVKYSWNALKPLYIQPPPITLPKAPKC